MAALAQLVDITHAAAQAASPVNPEDMGKISSLALVPAAAVAAATPLPMSVARAPFRDL
jgi:hypothetical protein